MKKVLLIIISFFVFNIKVYANEKPYLDSLEIMNGVNTLSFDKMNNLYTINVYEDIDALDISYKVKEDIDVSIIGNELIKEVNDVYINLAHDDEVNSYHLIVNKIDNTKSVMAYETKVEEDSDNPVVKTSIVFASIIINGLMLVILFHKKNPKKDLFIK